MPEESIEILSKVGAYVSANKEAIFATKRMPVYPYELTWGDLTCKEHHLYVHVFHKIPRAEVLGFANTPKRAYLVETGEELPFTRSKTCEGDEYITVELPKGYQDKEFYCIGIETEEEMPVFADIRE